MCGKNQELWLPAGGDTEGKHEKSDSFCRRNLPGTDRQPEKYGKQYERENSRWRAAIGFQGKVYNLGTFVNLEDAVAARKKAEEELYEPFLREHGVKEVQKGGI